MASGISCMADYSEKNLKKNSVLLAVYKAVSMVLSMLYVPVILGYLGTGLYGIWATILNVISWVNYFDIGIGNGLRNKLSAALAKDADDSKVKSLISSAYVLLSVVVLGVMAVALVVFQFIDWNALLNIPESLYGNAKAVVAVSFSLMCIGFVFSICKSLFFAVQDAHIVSLLGVAQQACMLMSVLTLGLFDSDRLMSVAIAYGLSALVIELAFTFAFFRKRRPWVPTPMAYDKDMARDVTGLGVQFFIIQMASLVLSSTDNVVVSNIFGPEAVTPYSTAFKLFTVPVSLYASMISPYWSSITARYARGDVSGIKGNVRHMEKLLALPAACCLVLALAYTPITDIWLGQHLDTSTDLVWLMFAYCLVYSWNAIWSQVSNGMACMKMMMALAVGQAIANIPLSYLFADMLGSSSGVLLGTIVAMLSSSVVYPVYINRKLAKESGIE